MNQNLTLTKQSIQKYRLNLKKQLHLLGIDVTEENSEIIFAELLGFSSINKFKSILNSSTISEEELKKRFISIDNENKSKINHPEFKDYALNVYFNGDINRDILINILNHY